MAMMDLSETRLRRFGFELQEVREGKPGGLLVQIRPPEGVPASLLNNAAGREFLRQCAARWNAVADALAKLDEEAISDAALEARIILREAILGKR